MTGKSYTMKEMKTIVEHLTENKLYGETKGRKMWMNLASSKLTTRTWQSLKETFLKRILPDIHNPYYELSIEQINNFRAGRDFSDQNKLEIHTISDESSNGNPNDTPQSNNDNGIKEEILAGENIICSKIPSRSRSSADTVIVETCYQTAEDIQKDLEGVGLPDNIEKRQTKSLRDCITYSEPLTPMLQEVLDDFQSEPENEPDNFERENQMEIVNSESAINGTDKNVEENLKNDSENATANDVVTDTPINKSAPPAVQELPLIDEPAEKITEKQLNNTESQEDINAVPLTEKDSDVVCLDDLQIRDENNTEKENANEKQDTTKNIESLVENVSDTIAAANSSENSKLIPASGTLNYSNNTDASLPNNPEALKKRKSDEKQNEKTPEKQTTSPTIVNKITRKRSNSELLTKITGIKSKMETKRYKASETESKKTTNIIALKKPKNVEPKDKEKEVDNTPNNKDEAKSDNTTPNLANILEKPSTSLAYDVDQVLLTSDSEGVVTNESGEIKNPCLQNVSLFEEQFNKTKYKWESSDAEQKKDEVTVEKKVQEKKENVILKSHTKSNSDDLPSSSKKHRSEVTSKKDRDIALANVFGFSSGAANSKLRRKLSRRKRTVSQNNISQNDGSDSSKLTSESESEEFVSPPRGRKNRHTKKYLKPQSGRILSLEEEGGLFVMYGKKIYPLVKDGKLVKNYLTYLPESESDEENYWKLKYVQEKRKAHQLQRLLEEAKEPEPKKSTATTEQPNPMRNSTCNHHHAQEAPNACTEISLPTEEKKADTKSTAPESNIKIKFTTKNDQEIHLEGNWPQIHNVLEHVVHIFHKQPQPVSEQKTKTIIEPPSSSGISTPVVITAHEPSVDPEVQERVNKIESEIFKEIEERDKEEQDQPDKGDSNVTKRNLVKPRKSSESSASTYVLRSPAKRQKLSEEDNQTNSTNTKEPVKENIVTDNDNKRPLRTSTRKILNETPNKDVTNKIQTRKSKLSLNTSANKDDEVRYMFPTRTKRQTVKANKLHKSTTKTSKVFSSPEIDCTNTMESTQGYQDSDPSPTKSDIRKKKYMNVSVLNSKAKSHLRRSFRTKTLPSLYCDFADVPAMGAPETKKRDNSTLDSEVYRSESYQLLMPQRKGSFRELEQIDETTLIGNEANFIRQLESTSKNEVFSVQMNDECNSRSSGLLTSDIGSSSNMSLPLSPELSVVDSLSISKDLLQKFEDGPTINEMQCNLVQVPTEFSQYLMSQIDVSVPLMQQECEFENCNVTPSENEPKGRVTESLISKISTFKIQDQTDLTETIDFKLRDLLLDSAKKITEQNEKISNNMEISDASVEVQKKTKNRKRCSTPRKRKDVLKSKKNPKVQPVIEEEHIESCSQGGRKSCPPVIQVYAPEEIATEIDFDVDNLSINENVIHKGRKKKDVIKVKILRPNKKSSNKKNLKENNKSICTDSGINDTESGVFACLPVDESVDLIHNHSETCLHANDCVGDSVEFVDNTIKSIICLGDSLNSGDNMWHSQCELDIADNISPDIFCNNAQDVRSFYKSKSEDNENTIETIFHSPMSAEVSSLITEDLSVELSQSPTLPNKWYLLSEDETTNANVADAQVSVGSFGANLKQIFPITCAVPDLSTISEMSRENDTNSRKPTLESQTCDAFDSQTNF